MPRLMDRFAILLAGPVSATDDLKAEIAGCRVVAADRGMMHAAALGIVPELWVGDFDSADAALDRAYRDVPRRTFPREKDRTDGELAIETAIERGARRILLVGALRGPRSDHAFAHLVLALRYAAGGVDVVLSDGREWAVPLRPGETRVRSVPGAAFSILKFSDLEGLTIENARWPLQDVALPFHSILTQSNEAAGEEVVVRLSSGAAVLLLQASTERD